MEVKSILVYVFLSYFLSTESFIIGEDHICKGNLCVDGRCPFMLDDFPFPCTSSGHRQDGSYCTGHCAMTAVPGDENYGRYLNLFCDSKPCAKIFEYEIWNYNFFRINPKGLLFPISDYLWNNTVINECTYVHVSGANGQSKCSIHIRHVANPETAQSRFCPRDCNGNNCQDASQITYQCAAFLPNYLYLGNKPGDFNGQLTATKHLKYKSIALPSYDSQLPQFAHVEYENLAENRYCRNGLMQIDGDRLSLLQVYKQTNFFTCNTQEPARWIILTAKVILIDTNIAINGCLKFILAAFRIEVKGKFRIRLRGMDITQTTRGRPSLTAEWRPDLAKGKSAGKIIAITTEWIVESQDFIQFWSIGGQGSCGSIPKFHPTPSHPNHHLIVDKMKFMSIEFDRPYQEMAFEYIDYLREKMAQCDGVGVRFHVYSALHLIENAGGSAEAPQLFGVKPEQQHLITGIAEQGPYRPCNLSMETTRPTFEIIHVGNCGFYVREHNHVNWYFYSQKKDLYFKKKYQGDTTDIRYHSTLFNSAFRKMDKWETEEQFQFLDVLRDAYAWFNINWKEFHYLELRFIITNSINIEDTLEFQLLRGLREVLLSSWDPSDVFQKWIFATVAIQERRVRTETSFIVRLLEFVKGKKDLLTTLYTAEERKKRIDAASKEYEDFNNDKIKAAEEILKDEVMPTLDKTKQRLNENFAQLIKEVEILISKAEVKKDDLRENMRKAESAMIANTILNVVGVLASALAFVGPVAGAVGGVVNVGVDLAKTFNEEINKPKIPAGYKMPESVRRDMNPVVSWIDMKQRRLETKIETIIKSVTTGETLSDFKHFLTDRLEELRKNKPRREQFEIMKKVEKDVKAELERLSHDIANTETESRDGGADDEKEKKDKQDKNVNVLNGAAGTMSAVDTTVKDIFKDNANIAKINSEIDAVNADLKVLREFAEKIYNTMIPMAMDLIDTFDYVTLEMNDTNLARIDVTQWSMESNIDDIKLEFGKVLKDFESGEDIIHSIDKIGKIFEIVSKIFSQISTIKDQKINAAFQKNLASATVEPVYEKFVKYMDTEMTKAVIRSEVTAVYNAFRQWSFPFVTVFMATLPQFQLGNGDEDSNATIQEALYIITEVSSAIENFELTIGSSVDKFKREGVFLENPSKGHHAFYSWNHLNFADKIYSLLSGNEVFFTADIVKLMMTGVHDRKQAIKFRTIGINFRVSKNPILGQQLRNLLEAYEFVMVHMGYSYYNFDGKIYLFTGQQLTFIRSFDQSTRNFAAKKAEGADAVLSPYGIWKFALQPNGQHDFSELIDLLEQNPEIELNLIGDGTYVGDVRGERFRDPLVESYFKPIDVVVLPEPQNRDRFL